MDNLWGEQDQLLADTRKVPETAAPALQKLHQQLNVVGGRIEEVEAKLEDGAGHYREAKAKVIRLCQQWADARSAVEQDVALRAKAEAVRRVVQKIVVTFVRGHGEEDAIGACGGD